MIIDPKNPSALKKGIRGPRKKKGKEPEVIAEPQSPASPDTELPIIPGGFDANSAHFEGGEQFSINYLLAAAVTDKDRNTPNQYRDIKKLPEMEQSAWYKTCDEEIASMKE